MELLHPGSLEAVLVDGEEAFKNESFDMISDGVGDAVNASSFTS